MCSFFHKVYLYLNTIKYLKSRQIFYRLLYLLNRFYTGSYKIKNNKSNLNIPRNISFGQFLYNKTSYKNRTFTFLNKSKTFNNIDWNYSEFGKLWTYNLNYFDYLNQKDITKKIGTELIYDFISKLDSIKDGLEPFPISLRGINWIKFLIRFNIKNKKINDSLYAQYNILLNSLEYHLLGNHLLENGFSLLFGGVYFNDTKLLDKAKKILYQELNEQILNDGAHFELSPMYHQLMLFRLLDCINLVKHNSNEDILRFLEEKAKKMLSWLKMISYKNGDIPLLNDSTRKIAPTTNQLLNYAKILNIMPIEQVFLKDSGYRKIETNNYECIIDIGKIGADYIPGHAHADTFNFELYINNKPYIVDTGISTYETNEIRFFERSTKAHNTVEINNTNSSEVWGSFRVANRAKVIKLIEKDDYIKATHDGYKKFGILHTREWKFCKDKIIIKDTLNKNANAIFRLHFHPAVSINEIKKRIALDNYTIKQYNYALEFNKRTKAYMIEKKFKDKLTTEIKI